MHASFTSVSTPDWTVEQMIDFAAETGYDAVELRCDYPDEAHDHGVSVGRRHVEATTQARREEIVELLDEAGVEICLLGTSCAFATADADERAANVGEAKEYVELAEELGASFVRVFGGPLPEELSWEEGRGYIVESLETLGEFADDSPVDVVLEQHDEWLDADDLVDIVGSAGPDSVGILWHITEGGTDPIETMGGRLDHTHVREYGPFLQELVDTLDAVGYEGYLSYERGTGPESLEEFIETVRPMIE